MFEPFVICRRVFLIPSIPKMEQAGVTMRHFHLDLAVVNRFLSTFCHFQSALPLALLILQRLVHMLLVRCVSQGFSSSALLCLPHAEWSSAGWRCPGSCPAAAAATVMTLRMTWCSADASLPWVFPSHTAHCSTR